MEYRFYGNEDCNVSPINEEYAAVGDPRHAYDLLSDIWCRYSCAPRMRDDWSPQNKTLGQCSITSFLLQDIYGGKVYGIPLEDGSYHCYNVVDGKVFDITSEQFPGQVLTYDLQNEQFRHEHFASREKEERYEYLRDKLKEKIG